MAYTFTNLSPPEFEDLTRDLIGKELDVRFEAFCQGPDGGIDGRHSSGDRSTVLQAKHYAGSTFPALKRVMTQERVSIDRLELDRYILATSAKLTPDNKATLARTVGPALKSEGDIFGPDDLNGLLRKYPDIDKANIKLWLSSTAVLDRIIHAATYFFTAVSREEIEAKVLVYAPNPSFREAQQKLEDQHVLIVSGPPGVGKTTLAEMLSYAYIADSWEFVAIRSLDEGFAAIVDAKKQIFYFDDFLGRVGLDQRALASNDSEIAKFIKRVRTTKNARFILTTRAHLFEEARMVSEHLGDRRLDITQYSLDVGVYTRQIKARILYNHLYVAKLPASYVAALWIAGSIPKIVDHRNYNPRIIEAMTESVLLQEVSDQGYPAAFIDALDNPHAIWDKAFRRHIAPMCRHLLLALFFCSEYGVEIDDLRESFGPLHTFLCRKYNIAFGVKDFDEALKILEGGFVAIRGTAVSFINPSLRDYLATYLEDAELLSDLAKNAARADWAESVWKKVKDASAFPADRRAAIALDFLPVVEKFAELPVLRPIPSDPAVYRFFDMPITSRLELLIEWWNASHDRRFARACLELTLGARIRFSAWRDGSNLVKLIDNLRSDPPQGFPTPTELADELEKRLLEILNSNLDADDIERIYRAVDQANVEFSDEIIETANRAVVREVGDATSYAASGVSESTIRDRIESLEYLGNRIGMANGDIAAAVEVLEARISTLDEETEEAPAPAITGKSAWTDKFDNDDLTNLFAPLIATDDAQTGQAGPITGQLEDVPF